MLVSTALNLVDPAGNTGGAFDQAPGRRDARGTRCRIVPWSETHPHGRATRLGDGPPASGCGASARGASNRQETIAAVSRAPRTRDFRGPTRRVDEAPPKIPCCSGCRAWLCGQAAQHRLVHAGRQSRCVAGGGSCVAGASAPAAHLPCACRQLHRRWRGGRFRHTSAPSEAGQLARRASYARSRIRCWLRREVPPAEDCSRA